MRNGFLERWYDPALEPGEIPGREALEGSEAARISRALAIILVAGTMPRRLGGDADDEALALDKKRVRRSSHALRQALAQWTKKPGQIDVSDEIRRLGAQLDWDQFKEAHVAEIRDRLRLVATWAIRANELRWGKSAVVNLENELNWFTYSLRD